LQLFAARVADCCVVWVFSLRQRSVSPIWTARLDRSGYDPANNEANSPQHFRYVEATFDLELCLQALQFSLVIRTYITLHACRHRRNNAFSALCALGNN
jgi:hypothetical protein